MTLCMLVFSALSEFLYPWVLSGSLSKPQEYGKNENARIQQEVQETKPRKMKPPQQKGILRKVSDDTLSDLLCNRTSFEKIGIDLTSSPMPVSPIDLILSEVVRRGGLKWEAKLKERSDSLLELWRQEGHSPAQSRSHLLVMSAYYRIKGLPDPIRVVIKGDNQLTMTYPEMPTFEVSILNDHPQKITLSWLEGGNYRHGRWESFGFEVTDARNRVMPIVVHIKDMMHTGGIVDIIELKHKEDWKNRLPLERYIGTLPPGRYEIRAVYAFGELIGSIQEKSRAFMLYSSPITIMVKPKMVTVSRKQIEEARYLCRSLPTEGPVRFIHGSYDPELHEAFMPPLSAAGRILQMGWAAVPTMVDSLNDKELDPTRRAWLLALLYSVTGLNSPTDIVVFDTERIPPGVLGHYEYVLGRRWGASRRILASGSRGRKIDVEKQVEFSKRWRGWKEECLKVTVQKDN